MVLYSPLLPPTIWVAVEISITALTIGLTSSSSKFVRLSGLLLVTTAAYLAFLTTVQHVSATFWASIFAGNAITYILRYLDLALLDWWNFDDRGPTGKKGEAKEKSNKSNTIKLAKKKGPSSRDRTAWQRLWFGFYTTLSSRQLNTPYQVKNVAAWSSTNLEHIPFREGFLWRTAIVVLFNYVIVDLCSFGAQPEQNAIMFSNDHIGFFSRLQDLSTEEVTIRVVASLAVWLNIYCIFRGINGLLGFLAVGSGISEVRDWAPPFGSFSQAYSIRRFWGNFWHQMYRQTFGGPARSLVQDVLHLPQDSLSARYSKILVTFYISGLLHLSTDVAIGIGWGESGAIRFFCMQAVGILIEDSVQALYRRIDPETQRPLPRQMLVRMIGFVWLGCFLAWTTPVWAYPAMRRNQGEPKDMVLPFSVIGMLQNGAGLRGQ